MVCLEVVLKASVFSIQRSTLFRKENLCSVDVFRVDFMFIKSLCKNSSWSLGGILLSVWLVTIHDSLLNQTSAAKNVSQKDACVHMHTYSFEHTGLISYTASPTTAKTA